jgi:TetR/AcrR family transcriptional regulator
MAEQPRRKAGRPALRPDDRAAIRDQALGLFAERGFDATSIGEIAAAAGVPKANVLYYFGSKDELWREAVDALFAEVDGFYAEHWTADIPSTLDGLARTVEVYLEACRRWPAYVRLPNLEGHADTWRMRWIAERHLRRHIAGARGFYRRLIAAGVLPDMDTVFLQNLIAGGGQLLLGQYELWRTATGSDRTPAEWARFYVRNLLALLRGPGFLTDRPETA